MSKITGLHVAIFSAHASADLAFLRDVLQVKGFDAGGGTQILTVPTAEFHVHPAERSGAHEFYLLCDDVAALVLDLKGRGVACSPVQDQGWGLVTEVALPGGGKLPVYQPRYSRP